MSPTTTLPNAKQAEQLVSLLQKNAEEYYKTPDGMLLKHHLALFETWIKSKLGI